MPPPEIVAYIEAILHERKISKASFYSATGVSAAVFSYWRTNANRPSLEALDRINNFLGTTLGIYPEPEKTAPALTGTEKQLLDIFKQLDDSGKAACLDMAKGLLRTFSQKNHTVIVNEVTG